MVHSVHHRMGCRCFWDSDTDNYAQDLFMNVSTQYIMPYAALNGALPYIVSTCIGLQDTMFCVAVAYGVYYY